MTNAIRTDALAKSFVIRTKAGRVRREKRVVEAVADVNLDIAVGEMVGFIGPNGAGKSTTIKMLTGVLAPSAGRVEVLGMVPLNERVRLARRIGVVFGQRSQLWWDLPLRDSFALLRHLYRVPATDHARTITWLSELFELGPLLDVPVRSLSLGQRMRAELAAAMAHQPELLFLDEPTIGLDVVSKHAVRDALAVLNRERGTTVVLTTHDLSDIEQLCRRVVIVHRGRVIEDGPLDALVDRLGALRTLVVDVDVDAGGEPAKLETVSVAGARFVRRADRTVWFEFDRRVLGATDVLRVLADVAPIRDLRIEEPDIEAIVRRIYKGS